MKTRTKAVPGNLGHVFKGFLLGGLTVLALFLAARMTGVNHLQPDNLIQLNGSVRGLSASAPTLSTANLKLDSAHIDHKGTIFVIITSYRDPECKKTLNELFTKAEFPQRIFVGSTEQRAYANESCLPPDIKFKSQVKLVNLPMTVQEGHIWSHYVASKLYSGQDYVLQVDAHTKLRPKWDSALISMLNRCPSKKPVLTHYPFDYEEYDSNSSSVPVMCSGTFNERGLFRFESKVVSLTEAALTPVPFVAGGFMFTLGSMLREVPYDPNYPFLWEGEEFLFSARLWTSGYDAFTPDTNVVFHQYMTDGIPRAMVWSDVPNWSERQHGAEEKWRYMLGLKPVPANFSDIQKRELQDYGLGKERTLKQYLEFAGLDLVKQTVKSEVKFCPSEATPEPSPTTAATESTAASNSQHKHARLLKGLIAL
eukprot:jgi/Chrzof1/10472/UNPLg00399.t1